MKFAKQFLLGIFIGFVLMSFGKMVYSKVIFSTGTNNAYPSMILISTTNEYSLFVDKSIKKQDSNLYAKTLHLYNKCLKIDNACIMSIVSVSEYNCNNGTKTIIKQNVIDKNEDLITTSLINIKNGQEIKEICNRYETK